MAKNKNIFLRLNFSLFSSIRSIIKVIDPDAPKHHRTYHYGMGVLYLVDSLELRVRGRYGGRGPARPTHMHDVCQHHRSSPLPSYRIAQLARMHAQIAHRTCVCGGTPSECSSLPNI